ncbi:nucleotidyltransferase family protein [Microbacterium pumilum]|uniref:Nucleotidyltransferase family protein n=1 Tax=Microbacterium pumilum TaxID=344165 RepID=A0ABN2RZY3_9MICO
MRVCGLVLAAGGGTRYGRPKGLVRGADGVPWVARAVDVLRDGGCDGVVVLVGAAGDEVAALVPEWASVVTVADWADGLAATLRAGLATASTEGWDAVAITPVDTPDAAPAAVARVLGALRGRSPLVQAVYGGVPGHPVAIARSHFAPLAEALDGDRGARPYLAAHGVVEVECADLWSGEDVDRP